MSADIAKTEIEGRLKVHLDMASERDIENMIKHYTEDVVFMPNGHPTIRGRKDLLQYLKKSLPHAKVLYTVTIEVIDITNDQTAFVKCLISTADQKGKLLSMLHSSYLWKKLDGEWLIDRHMFLFAQSDELLYEDTVRKEIKVKTDYMFEALSKGDIETGATVDAENVKVAVPFHDTIIGRAAVKEQFGKMLDAWKNIKYKQVYFEMLNNDTVYVNNKVDSCDEKTGKILKSYRDIHYWKKIKDAGWFLDVVIITEMP